MYSSTKCRPQLAILCFIIVVVKPKGVNNMDLEKIGKFITEQRTNKKLSNSHFIGLPWRAAQFVCGIKKPKRNQANCI